MPRIDPAGSGRFSYPAIARRAIRRTRSGGSASAVILDVRFRTKDIGDLLLRTRRHGLIDLELGDGGLAGAGDVVRLSGALCRA